MKTKNYYSILIVITVLLMNNLNFAQWTQRTDMPTARSFAASCELDGKIYVIGGGTSVSSSTNIMEVYDPVTDTWDITKTDMPTARAELCVVVFNGKIYTIGGATSHTGSPLGMVEVYDPLTDSWETNRTPMPTPRIGAAVGVIGNKIYVAGGSANSNYSPSNKLEIYDPVTDTWDVTKTNMPSAKYDPRGVVLNNMFYVIGGLIGSPWTGQKTVQIYDPSTDTWSYGPDLHYGRVGHTANAYNEKIYVIGGESQFIPIVSMEIYDLQTNSWEDGEIPDVMNIHCSSLFGTDLYILGGTKCGITSLCPTDDVFSYQLIGWTLLPSGTGNKLLGVSFTDANTGTVVGGGGTILNTYNGGVTWDYLSINNVEHMWDVNFINTNIGMAVGAVVDFGYIIMKTTDGGISWDSLYSGTTPEYGLYGIFLIDENKATAVGQGTILRTTDGGASWVSQSNQSWHLLTDVYFTDVDNGTVVGTNGTILHTTNGGTDWVPRSSGTVNDLWGVWFIDANIGTAVGRHGKILRTTDGAATWDSVSINTTNDIWDVCFTDANIGTVVTGWGYGGDHGGEIFRTTDGGLTWLCQLEKYPAGFHGVYFTDENTGTVVGAGGTILRTATGGVTWVEENPKIYEQIPIQFYLQQNYPNPFNPSTKIRYSIPHSANVVIKVFDILGNEIETLVNEEKQSGTYEVEFNSHSGEVRNLPVGRQGLPSGVYFYQLRSGNFIQTKKMVLLK